MIKSTENLLATLNRICEFNQWTPLQMIEEMIAQQDDDTLEMIWEVVLSGNRSWATAWMKN